MAKIKTPDREQQEQVNTYFLSTLDYWDAIYRESGVYQTIYQRRGTVALSLVDKLALPAGSRVLEVGCAQGLTTIAVAERGFFVEAVDAVPEMISALPTSHRQNDAELGVAAHHPRVRFTGSLEWISFNHWAHAR